MLYFAKISKIGKGCADIIIDEREATVPDVPFLYAFQLIQTTCLKADTEKCSTCMLPCCLAHDTSKVTLAGYDGKIQELKAGDHVLALFDGNGFDRGVILGLYGG